MTRYRRDPRFVLREVAGRRVLVPASGGLDPDTFLLLLDGPVAQAVWEALAEPRSLDELVAAVTARFAVEQDVAEADVRRFLAELLTGGCAAES